MFLITYFDNSIQKYICIYSAKDLFIDSRIIYSESKVESIEIHLLYLIDHLSKKPLSKTEN